MRINYLLKMFALVNVCYLALTSVAFAACPSCSRDPSMTPAAQILLNVPRDNASVGVVPYYIDKQELYVLLGRVRLDQRKTNAHAGKFSDFGGKIALDGGSSYVQYALHSLFAQSMGQLMPSEQDLLSKSQLLHKTNHLGQQVIYLLYPLTEQDYLKTKKFNSLRVKLARDKKISQAWLEKDLFYWFKLVDIINFSGKLSDIDGEKHQVALLDSFVQDFVMNRDLVDIIKDLT